MRILITGGAGYIGSHVVKLLGEQQHNIVVYDNLSTGHREAVLYGKFVSGDLGDESALTKLFDEHDFDAVIHFAASIFPDESVEQPLAYYQNNTCNTLKLIQQCQRCDIRYFVFSSTAAVYQSKSTGAICEDDKTGPVSPYGWSKLMSERILMDTAAVCDIQYAILRYYNVAGADPEAKIGSMGKPRHLIKVACQAAVGMLDGINLYGTDYDTPDGTCIRDYIHVSDLADIHIRSLEMLAQDHKNFILNCGYGHGYSVKEILAEAQKVTGVEFPIREVGRRAGDPPQLISDNSQLKHKLSWRPQFDDIGTIIRSAWEWEKKLQRNT